MAAQPGTDPRPLYHQEAERAWSVEIPEHEGFPPGMTVGEAIDTETRSTRTGRRLGYRTWEQAGMRGSSMVLRDARKVIGEYRPEGPGRSDEFAAWTGHPRQAQEVDNPHRQAEPLDAAPAPIVTGSGSSDDMDLERVRLEAERRFREKHHRAQAKVRQSITLPHGPACLFFVGDQHIGNAGSDIRRMYAERDLMMATPGAVVWMMGDVVDNFIVGKLMAQNMKPSTPVWEQWALAKDYLASFEDRLVAVVGGNHGAWTQMLTGIDYRRDITPEGVLYDGDEVRADVRVGRSVYPVWARHQWRGSSIYNQTHGQERAARFNDPAFTFYVGAHLHTGAVCREFIHEGKRKAAIQIGAYKVHDDYARRLGFPGSDGSTAAALVLHDDGSWFPCADLEAAQHYMKAVYGRAA